MSNIVNTIKDNITFENVLALALKSPGVKINRGKFLHKELIKYYAEDIVAIAIKTTPAKAGISKEIINKISKQVINSETTKVTSLSFAASLPGGVAAAGAASADIISYFCFVLRSVQELAYLYGFEEFDLNDNEVDSETMQLVLVFIGVMFGVHGAAVALQKFADILSKQVAKQLAQKALTKGLLYPIVKNVAKKVGVHMTKQIFADGVASAIPILGGFLSGTLTYAMFKPCCLKLRSNLMNYNLCDPDFYHAKDVDFVEVIDIEPDDVES